MTSADRMLAAAGNLSAVLAGFHCGGDVTHVYNPLTYARRPHEVYLRRFGTGRKRILFLGMNPGPWGMAQTGVPFGEIAAVRDWMGISEPVDPPELEHPKRKIEGFACKKSEVSGRRLWGLFAQKFGTADAFFKEHFVLNYCPLVFMEASGRNRTPDKLSAAEQALLERACDECLAVAISALEPEWLIGVGGYAEAALQRVASASGTRAKIGKILHPSPASPVANRDWAGTATRQLKEQGVWPGS
jgi:single-strand selective monofunctional uracil DNA glycosylase